MNSDIEIIAANSHSWSGLVLSCVHTFSTQASQRSCEEYTVALSIDYLPHLPVEDTEAQRGSTASSVTQLVSGGAWTGTR